MVLRVGTDTDMSVHHFGPNISTAGIIATEFYHEIMTAEIPIAYRG